MADSYLKNLHLHFDIHSPNEDTVTVLLSQLWNMKNWTDIKHYRITLELIAEVARSENIHKVMITNR